MPDLPAKTRERHAKSSENATIPHDFFGTFAFSKSYVFVCESCDFVS